LPDPSQTLHVQSISVAPPGVQRVVVHEAAFALKAGSAVGVIGPSGSGKSSLARALVGVWPAVRGKVCLDGAALSQWRSEDLGDHIGYLPQEVELFSGTVAENISRFAAEIDPNAVIKAARLADVHDLILRLPEGYETRLNEGGASLSVGQRQRIALARALYRDPFLVVLDEPNSNLDAEGENALTNAIAGLRERGAIAVVVAHRPSAIAACDHVLMMSDGRIQAFGPKDEVLSKILQHPSSRPAQPAPATSGAPGSLKVVQEVEA
jgi:ATP-binding cassette subfamily C protein